MRKNELVVKGKQEFMGREIPVVLGGFGEGKKSVSDKTIAEIHEMETWNVRARITDNIKRFTENVDFIDIKQRLCLAGTLGEKEYYTALLIDLGYAKQSITQAEHIYILSERGYAKLIKIMDTDLAWEIHDKLMDGYFQMREEKGLLEDISPELRAVITVDKRVTEVNKKVDTVERKVDYLEDNMNIDYSQQKQIKNLASDVVVDAVGGKGSRAYRYRDEDGKMICKCVFKRFWNDFYDYFNINAYANLPRVRFEEALQYINQWKPPINMQLEIGRINRMEN